MARVGVVKEIWRFPVKSMQGDTIERCTLTPTGVVGDRRWAMRDEGRAEIQWGKMYPQLMLCRARYRAEPEHDEIAPVDVTFPDGETVGSDDPKIDAKLTELIEREATLRAIEPATNIEFYKRYKPDEEKFLGEIMGAFAREPGEPMPDLSVLPEVLMDHVAVPGTFFDNEEVHMITTASMEYMRGKNPSAQWDVRRFRPNFYIETDPEFSGLVENDWAGKTLTIGSASLDVTLPTLRCGMTVRPQADIEFDKSILRTVVKEGNQCLGVGAHVRASGEIQRGDVVELSG